MARPVLGATSMTRSPLVIVGLLCALVACAPAATKTPAPAASRGTTLTCDGDLSAASAELRAQYDAIRQRIEGGPLYKSVVERAGAPNRCVHAIRGGALRLTYAFPKRAIIDAQIDPRIELSGERADMPGLAESDAITLLQAAEKYAYGAKGCGIDWQKPEIEVPGTFGSARETVYRGDVCNCQARILQDGTGIIAVLIRSAC